MTTYTNITNGLVAVGAKPFATTIQALRDNPLAIAEGDITAPKVKGLARTLTTAGSATLGADAAALTFTGLPAMLNFRCEGSLFYRNATAGSLHMQISDDNGGTWDNLATLISTLSTSGSADKFTIWCDFVPGATNRAFYATTSSAAWALLGDAPMPVNAIRFIHSASGSGGLLLAGATAKILMNYGDID